ncbi:MAG: uracil-DNA glycosylase family protein [Desulforhopalus sp.]|nr:uracil-DNA glycosylase family protein [Desulforhopalus sp.]
MFFHTHPYEIFIPEGTEKIIVGTLPPPRFSEGKLRERDVNFCYGSCDGMLWPVLDEIFHLGLRFDNSPEAVKQRQDFLLREKLGICDIVESCKRSKIDASDLGMTEIRLRNILQQLQLHPTIKTLIFTGGNPKNGPEYLFRRQLKAHGLKLHPVSTDVPRVHQFTFLNREYSTISLTSPSNAANRAIGSSVLYKKRKKENPSYTTFDFRVEQYQKVFLKIDCV